MSDNTPVAPPPPEPSAPRPVPGPEPASSRGWKSELISLIRFSFGPLLGAVVLTATFIGGIYFYRAQDFDQIRTVNDVLTKTLTRVASVSDENMKTAAKIIKLQNEVVNSTIRGVEVSEELQKKSSELSKKIADATVAEGLAKLEVKRASFLEKQALSEKLTTEKERDKAKAEAETARLEATEERKKAEDARQEVAEATKSAAVAEERAASLTKENENRLDNLRLLWDKVERANREKQSAEEEEKRAQAQITDLRAEAERLNAHLYTLKKQEIQYLRDDLEEIISKRLRDMVTWREKANALAKSIVENDDEDARLLSVEILKDASTSQALPETVIKAYSSDRSRENFERIRHIIGITANQFQDIVQDGANYKMWIHVQKFGYFGTLVKTGEIPIDVLLFRYFDNNIISDVRLWSKYSSVRLPSFDDWYQTRTYRVYLDADSFSAFRIIKEESERGWNLFDKDDIGAELIFGHPSVIPHLGPHQFLNYYGMPHALDTRKDG